MTLYNLILILVIVLQFIYTRKLLGGEEMGVIYATLIMRRVKEFYEVLDIKKAEVAEILISLEAEELIIKKDGSPDEKYLPRA